MEAPTMVRIALPVIYLVGLSFRTVVGFQQRHLSTHLEHDPTLLEGLHIFFKNIGVNLMNFQWPYRKQGLSLIMCYIYVCLHNDAKMLLLATSGGWEGTKSLL